MYGGKFTKIGKTLRKKNWYEIVFLTVVRVQSEFEIKF